MEDNQRAPTAAQSQAPNASRGGRGRGFGRGRGGRGAARGSGGWRQNQNANAKPQLTVTNPSSQPSSTKPSGTIFPINSNPNPTVPLIPYVQPASTSQQPPRKANNNKNRNKNKNKPAEKNNTTEEPNKQAEAPQKDPTKKQKPKKNLTATQQQQQQPKHKPTKNDGNNKPNPKQSSTQTAILPLIPSISPKQPQQTNDVNYGRGNTITVFHVAEKPSIAEAIAKGLNNANRRMTSKSLPVHEFTNPSFPKAPHASKCNHIVTSVAGHVFSIDFAAQFQNWDAVDPAELFDAPTVRKPNQGSVVRHLQTNAKNADFIVLWMDCDREGENINFEVLDCVMHLMKSGGTATNMDRVYRAYFSAITPSDIMKAYHSLGKPDKNQSLSVEARQELDLKVGVAFSRFQTRYFQGQYGNLDSAVLSYGPCQTPTLGFCVQRHIDIETFKPEPFWALCLNVIKRGRSLSALWGSGRSFNKNRVEKLLDKALEHGVTAAQVTDVVSKEKKQGRPIPLNTTALLKACSKALGIGPHAAMQTAERLYLMGYLSYPRTESSAYPKSFDIPGTLRQQSSDPRWGSYVARLLIQGHNKSRGGVDMGDHPPITPCRAAGPNELSGDMARVYDFVVRHFIASVSNDAIWKSSRVDFAVATLEEKGTFTLRGKQIVDPGFLEVLLHKEYGEDADKRADGYEDDEDEEDREIPDFTKGELIPLTNTSSSTEGSAKIAVVGAMDGVRGTLRIKEGVTTAPKYLTESELISLMEKHGIGTDASIATHIENIQKRNYVSLETGRRLHPSKLGLVLVQGYHQIDSSLVLPRVRSDIEGQCNKIAKGEASKDAVVAHALSVFRSKYEVFVKDIQKMNILFSTSFSKLEDVGKPFTRCGLTRRYLQFINGPPPRLYNKWTETVYPLPQGGVVKQWSGRLCPVEGCNFELCLYSTGQPERTFPLCPRCFNAPEWALATDNLTDDLEDQADQTKERQMRRVAGKSLCLECPLPDNHPLIEELTVAPDPDSDGVLMLDPHFGPKWRFISTRAPTVVYLPKSIDNVVVMDERDEVFGMHKIKVEFKAKESPLLDKSQKHICSFAMDELLQGTSRVYHGQERSQGSGRGGRGRGRGGGRGGRGRGGRGGRSSGRR